MREWRWRISARPPASGLERRIARPYSAEEVDRSLPVFLHHIAGSAEDERLHTAARGYFRVVEDGTEKTRASSYFPD